MLTPIDHNSQDILYCQNNLYNFWKALASVTSKIVIENDKYLCTPLNTNNPINNAVFLFSKCNANPQALSHELSQKLKSIKTSWWCDSSMHGTKSLEILKQFHLHHLGPVPIMHYDLSQTIPTQNHYVVEEWEDGKNLDDFITPVAICFNMMGGDEKIYQHALEANHDKFKHFYVRDKQKVVGVGSLFFDGNTIGCYNLAVLPEYRKQDIATAIHIARLNMAKQMYFKSLTLQATPMAKNLAYAVGYQAVSELNIFW